VKSQSDHLGEVGHGSLAPVALPVGVRRETRGSVEREMWTERSESLRIKRQNVLQPQNRVGKKTTHQTEG
jgi:hypothetical protein